MQYWVAFCTCIIRDIVSGVCDENVSTWNCSLSKKSAAVNHRRPDVEPQKCLCVLETEGTANGGPLTAGACLCRRTHMHTRHSKLVHINFFDTLYLVTLITASVYDSFPPTFRNFEITSLVCVLFSVCRVYVQKKDRTRWTTEPCASLCSKTCFTMIRPIFIFPIRPQFFF